MNMFKRIAQWFARHGIAWDGLDFPKPDKTIMNLEEITQWWNALPSTWKRQCVTWIYRIRKTAEGDLRPNVWKVYGLPLAVDIRRHFLETAPETAADIEARKWGNDYGDVSTPFTIRIERHWEPSPGVSKKEEVCIANFTLTMERES